MTSTQISSSPEGSEVKKNHNGAQSFNKIGLFEAINGNIVLRGRHGERDHIYPLEKAIKQYHDTLYAAHKLMQNGFPNWEELVELNREFKFRILEALEQRRSLNIETPKELLDQLLLFEQQHGDDPVIRV